MNITELCKILNITPLYTEEEISRSKKIALKAVISGPDESQQKIKINESYKYAIDNLKGHNNLLHLIKTADDLHNLIVHFNIEQNTDLISALQETVAKSTTSIQTNSWYLPLVASNYLLGSTTSTYITTSILLAAAIKNGADYYTTQPENQLMRLIQNKEDLKKILAKLPEEKSRSILMLIRHMVNFQKIAKEEIMSDVQQPDPYNFIKDIVWKQQKLTWAKIIAEGIKYLPSVSQSALNNLQVQIYNEIKIKNLISDNYQLNEAQDNLIQLFLPINNNAQEIITYLLSILEENAAREKTQANTETLLKTYRMITESYKFIRIIHKAIYDQISAHEDKDEKLSTFYEILNDQLPIDIYAQLYNALAEDVSFDFKTTMTPNRRNYYTMIDTQQDVELITSPLCQSEELIDDDDLPELTMAQELPQPNHDHETTETDTPQDWITIESQMHSTAHNCIKENFYTIVSQTSQCLDEIINSLSLNSSLMQSEEKAKDKIKFIIKIKLAIDKICVPQLLITPTEQSVSTFIALCRVAIETCNFETNNFATCTKFVTKKIDEQCHAELTGARSKQKLLDVLAKNDLIFPSELFDEQLLHKIQFCLINNLSPINIGILFNLKDGMVFHPYIKPQTWSDTFSTYLPTMTSLQKITESILDPSILLGAVKSFGLFATAIENFAEDNDHPTHTPENCA